MAARSPGTLNSIVSGYGMLAVLALLCAFFSISTLKEEHPTGRSGAVALDDMLGDQRGKTYIIATQNRPADAEFATELTLRLAKRGFTVVGVFAGDPPSTGEFLRGLPP